MVLGESWMLAGVITGIVVGVLVGIIVILLLRVGAEATISSVTSAMTIVSGFVAIPVFWLGGSWLGTGLLSPSNPEQFGPPYMISSLVVILLVAGFPLIIFIGQSARKLGSNQ